MFIAVRRGGRALVAPQRLSAGYAVAKHCPPIRSLHNRIEMHLARLVLFYSIKIIVFFDLHGRGNIIFPALFLSFCPHEKQKREYDW